MLWDRLEGSVGVKADVSTRTSTKQHDTKPNLKVVAGSSNSTGCFPINCLDHGKKSTISPSNLSLFFLSGLLDAEEGKAEMRIVGTLSVVDPGRREWGVQYSSLYCTNYGSRILHHKSNLCFFTLYVLSFSQPHPSSLSHPPLCSARLGCALWLLCTDPDGSAGSIFNHSVHLKVLSIVVPKNDFTNIKTANPTSALL